MSGFLKYVSVSLQDPLERMRTVSHFISFNALFENNKNISNTRINTSVFYVYTVIIPK